MRVVLLDNRDSFVYNLVDQFASSGASIEVYRNTLEAGRILDALVSPHDDGTGRDRPILVLSPGPGHPAEAGCLMELLDAALSRAIPTLGICLGFQALVTACAGAVARIGPVHGKSTRVELTEEGRADPVLSRLHEPLHVARYHSLGTRRLPAALIPLAGRLPRTRPAPEWSWPPATAGSLPSDSSSTPNRSSHPRALHCSRPSPKNSPRAEPKLREPDPGDQDEHGQHH